MFYEMPPETATLNSRAQQGPPTPRQQANQPLRLLPPPPPPPMNGLASLNSTAHRFIGTPQRPWMLAQAGDSISTTARVQNARPSQAAFPQTWTQQTPPPQSSAHAVVQTNYGPDKATAAAENARGRKRPYDSTPANMPANVSTCASSALPASLETVVMSAPVSGAPVAASAPSRGITLALSSVSAPISPDSPVGAVPPVQQQPFPRTRQAPPDTAPPPVMSATNREHQLRLDHFMLKVLESGQASDVVNRKASLLKEALRHDDIFYVCLHQVYSRAFFDPLFSVQMGYGNDHLLAFNALKPILIPNDHLPRQILDFFASFPSTKVQRTSELYPHIVAQVGAFLPGFGRGWDSFRKSCLARGYPPFAAELRARFSMGSVILQKIAFLSVHEQLRIADGRAPNVSLDHQLLWIFESDQRRGIIALREGGAPPNNQMVDRETRALGEIYSWYKAAREGLIGSGLNAQGIPLLFTAPSPYILAWPVAGQPSLPQQTLPSPSSPSSTMPPSTTQAPQRWGRPPRIQPEMQVSPPTQFHPAAVVASPTVASSVRRQGGRPPSQPQNGSNSTVNQNPPLVNNKYPLLIPALGQEPIQVSNPDPKRVALHQSYLQSPKYLKISPAGTVDPDLRLYAIFTSFAITPTLLGPMLLFRKLVFNVSPHEFSRKAIEVTLVDSMHLARPFTRKARHGSLLYRLRCIELRSDSTGVNEASWVTGDTVWPKFAYVKVNGSHVELRRKTHHGKDLPLDLTAHIRSGVNNITFSTLRTKDTDKKKLWAVAVEVVEVIDQEHIEHMPAEITPEEALTIITKTLAKSNGGDDTEGNGDEDLRVVDAHVSIDMTDPFTSRIFNVPVRGKACLHRECFDRDTFFETRKSRLKNDGGDARYLTSPDEWKCPICGKDARPGSLIVDGFMKKVREELVKEGSVESVKAILVKADGSWSAKMESSDGGGGKRDGPNKKMRYEAKEGGEGIVAGSAKEGGAAVAAVAAAASRGPTGMIIELDSD